MCGRNPDKCITQKLWNLFTSPLLLLNLRCNSAVSRAAALLLTTRCPQGLPVGCGNKTSSSRQAYPIPPGILVLESLFYVSCAAFFFFRFVGQAPAGRHQHQQGAAGSRKRYFSAGGGVRKRWRRRRRSHSLPRLQADEAASGKPWGKLAHPHDRLRQPGRQVVRRCGWLSWAPPVVVIG